MLDYEALYEHHAAAASSDEEIVGAGDFDRVGAIELAALREAGLQATDVLVDFGCGVGRLALHAVPFLQGGHYIGVEISRTILDRAEKVVREAFPDPPCQVTWLHNANTTFPLDDGSVDVVCAFSVFTHMEHEDSYRYLVDALRVVRPGRKLVFSCLPLELALARQVFIDSAALPLTERWGRVRNVTTSRDLMDALSSMAGWKINAWYGGDYVFSAPEASERTALEQAVCVLERPT
jgi:SAM-dependent methyltransferase